MAERLRAHFGRDRFLDWAEQAQPGARVLYGVGDHAVAACADGVAEMMRGLADCGFVMLTSRRRSQHDAAQGCSFDYLAVRTSKAWRMPNRDEVVKMLDARKAGYGGLAMFAEREGLSRHEVGAVYRGSKPPSLAIIAALQRAEARP